MNLKPLTRNVRSSMFPIHCRMAVVKIIGGEEICPRAKSCNSPTDGEEHKQWFWGSDNYIDAHEMDIDHLHWIQHSLEAFTFWL